MRALFLSMLVAAAGCAPVATSAPLPDVVLPASDGPPRQLAEIARAAPFTVVVFFAADCPVQRAHDARLRELFERYRARGVAMIAVDSEATAAPAIDRRTRRVPTRSQSSRIPRAS